MSDCDEHRHRPDPEEYVKITICREEDIYAERKHAVIEEQWKRTDDEHIMPGGRMDARRDDRDDVHARMMRALDDVELPADVERTIERLHRVGAWMDEQDPMLKGEQPIMIRGDYTPFRRQDLYLATGTDSYGRERTPAVPATWTLGQPVEEARDRAERAFSGVQVSNLSEAARASHRADPDRSIDRTPSSA